MAYRTAALLLALICSPVWAAASRPCDGDAMGTAAAASKKGKEPTLPFGIGNIITVTSPDLPKLVCDVKDATSYGALVTGGKKGGGKDDDTLPVRCDRLAPSGPGAQYAKNGGFLVLPQDPTTRTLPSGATLALSSVITGKACRADTKTGVVVCNAKSHSDPEAQFQVFVAGGKKVATEGHGWLVQAAMEALDAVLGKKAQPWGPSPGGGSGGSGGQGSTSLEVNVLHVASDRWCGANTDSKRAELVCDVKSDKHKPSLLVKVDTWGPSQ